MSSYHSTVSGNSAPRNPSLLHTAGIEILSFPTLLGICFVGIAYIFSVDLLLNYKLITASITQHFPLPTLISLVGSLFVGSFTSMSAEPYTLYLVLFTALLVGLNVVLLIRAIMSLGGNGKIHLSLGGATLFSIVTAGCASCGLSLLSVLGLSASLSFLPFHGTELRPIAIVLLLISAYFMLRQLHEAKYCRVKGKKK